MLENLDLTPRQVAVEAKFLTVQKTDLEKIGVSWEGQVSDVGDRPRRLVDQDTGQPIPATYTGVVGSNADGTDATAEIPYYLNHDGTSRLPQTFSSGVMSLAEALVGGIGDPNFAVTALLKQNEDGDYIQATIEFLSRLSNSELLSAPKVVALNRKPAMFADVQTEYFDSYRMKQITGGGISFGVQQDYGVVETVLPQMWAFGITLSVTAQIGKGEQIRLWLNPQIIDKVGEKEFESTTTIGDVSTTSTQTFPTTDVKAVWSNVIVHDGDTLVLGGMVEDAEIEVTEKLPYLSDIPVIGRLFRGDGKSSRQRNLLIFVTPTIIDTTGAKFFRGE
jgi:general secretion pathway protein D